jgi:hypothetical protein
VNNFGNKLRRLRQNSNDPDLDGRRLSQERYGELVGRELGTTAFSGAAVSKTKLCDWKTLLCGTKTCWMRLPGSFSCGKSLRWIGKVKKPSSARSCTVGIFIHFPMAHSLYGDYIPRRTVHIPVYQFFTKLEGL